MGILIILKIKLIMIGNRILLLTLLLGLVFAEKTTVIEEKNKESLIRLTLSSYWDENNKPVMKGKIYMKWFKEIKTEWGDRGGADSNEVRICFGYQKKTNFNVKRDWIMFIGNPIEGKFTD